MDADTLTRFDAKWIAEPNTGCFLWTSSLRSSGYGELWVKRGGQAAHRLAYEHHVGPIPPGLCVLHRCDTPACVNPEHLFVGTNQDNVDDKMRKGRHKHGQTPRAAVCIRGHALDASSKIVIPRRGRTEHACKACAKIREKVYRDRRKAAGLPAYQPRKRGSHG